jgi:hypothetical protein
VAVELEGLSGTHARPFCLEDLTTPGPDADDQDPRELLSSLFFLTLFLLAYIDLMSDSASAPVCQLGIPIQFWWIAFSRPRSILVHATRGTASRLDWHLQTVHMLDRFL